MALHFAARHDSGLDGLLYQPEGAPWCHRPMAVSTTTPLTDEESVDVDSSKAEDTPLVGDGAKSEPAEQGGKGRGPTVLLLLAVLITGLASWKMKTLLGGMATACEYLQSVPTMQAGVAVFGIIILESLSPLPVLSITLVASGFVLGFPTAFFFAYPPTVLGSCLLFLLAKSCCLKSATSVIADRPKLKAITGAIKHGGLKLVILIRVAPTPVFWATIMFATCEVSLHEFAIAYALVNLKYTLYCYMGAATGDIMTALTGEPQDAGAGALVEGSASGSWDSFEPEPVDPTTNTLQHAITVAGLVSGIVALAVVGRYTKAELAKYEGVSIDDDAAAPADAEGGQLNGSTSSTAAGSAPTQDAPAGTVATV